MRKDSMVQGRDSLDWPIVAFGDVVQLNRDRIADPVAAGIERYLGIEHIEPEDLRIRRWGLVEEGTTFSNAFQPGQVLFVKRRAYQRKVAVADFAGVCSGDIYVLESKDSDVLLPELLPFICQTEGFFEHAVGTSAGSLSPRTNWTQLATYEFALPPLAEQRRIAEVLWAVEELREAYNQITYDADRLIASLVNHLTVTQTESDTTQATSIEMLGLQGEPVMKTGPFGSNLKTSYFRETGIPIITIGSLQDFGLDRSQFFYLDPKYQGQFESYETTVGDIVFSRVADVGRCYLITELEAGFIISSNLIRIRVDSDLVRPKYLFLLLKYSTQLRRQIAGIATQAAGRLLVNTRTMRLLSFVLPDLGHQDLIISQVEQNQIAREAIYSRLLATSSFFEVLRERSL